MYQTITYFKRNQNEIHRELLVKKYVQWTVVTGKLLDCVAIYAMLLLALSNKLIIAQLKVSVGI
jgi:hypothetical protein